MRALKGILVGAVAAIMAAPSVRADGLYIPSASYSWNGPYLGITVGYANGFHSFDDLAGAFLGYPGLSNEQSDGFIARGTLGIELAA